MSTLTAPQTVFTSGVPRQVQRSQSNASIFGLVATYALVPVLLFLAARGAFSVQGIGFNSPAGQALNPDSGQGSTLHSVELLVFFGTMLLAMYPVLRQLSKACVDNYVLFLLPFWAIISSLWSSDPFRSFSFGVLALILTLFGLYLAVRFSPRQQLQLFLFAGIMATALSLLLVIAMPSAGIDYKNSTVGAEGIYPSKNICSNITLVLLISAFFYQFPGKLGKLKRAIYIGLHLVLIAAALARAGWAELLLVALFIVLLRFIHRLRPLERFLVTGFVPALALVFMWLVYVNSAPILKFLGKDPTLSGRTIIWSVVPLSIAKQPIIGFGYAAFFTVNNPEAHRLALAAGDPFLSNAENGVLQLLLELGSVGLIFLLIVLTRATINAVRCFRNNTPGYLIWYMALLFNSLLSLVDGNKFMLPTAIEWPLLIMAYIGLEVEARRLRSLGAA